MGRRNSIAWLVVAAIVAALVGSRVAREGDASSELSSGQVVRVVDGDTIHVRSGSREETVRYIGVDTPESVKPNTPVQCYAKTASHYNAALVDGRQVRLVMDREARDRYGRLLAYVYLAGDGTFVNARLVAGGYARTLEIAPNTRFASRFAMLQSGAQASGRGLWGRCNR